MQAFFELYLCMYFFQSRINLLNLKIISSSYVHRRSKKKSKHTYVAVTTKVCSNEEDGDFVVMFLNKHGIKGDTFTANEGDESVIDFSQVKVILPHPELIVKGQRVLYQFPFSLNEDLN
jgi:hypothetical protein